MRSTSKQTCLYGLASVILLMTGCMDDSAPGGRAKTPANSGADAQVASATATVTSVDTESPNANAPSATASATSTHTKTATTTAGNTNSNVLPPVYLTSTDISTSSMTSTSTSTNTDPGGMLPPIFTLPPMVSPTACGRNAVQQGDPSVASVRSTIGTYKDSGYVAYIPSGGHLVGLATTMIVPPPPGPKGTLFLWPGIQPDTAGAHYLPIDNGVLQPVLTWGPTCAPFAPLRPYASWWVSAQYVNTFGHAPGRTGCNGGPGMSVAVGDSLDMTMTLIGNTWRQVVTSKKTGQSVSFDIDMRGQEQNWASFVIEPWDGAMAATDVEFVDTVLSFDNAIPACLPRSMGPGDSVSPAWLSQDGSRCCIEKIKLSNGIVAVSR